MLTMHQIVMSKIFHMLTVYCKDYICFFIYVFLINVIREFFKTGRYIFFKNMLYDIALKMSRPLILGFKSHFDSKWEKQLDNICTSIN